MISRFMVFASALALTIQADPPLVRARHVTPTVAVKIFNDRGSVRLVGWDRDSIAVRGKIPRGEQFFFVGSDTAMKLGIDAHRDGSDAGAVDLVVYLPQRATVSLKTVSASIDGRDVSGWFYTVSGSVHLAGNATSLDVQSMLGDLALEVRTPYLRARNGEGKILLGGAPEDADLSTISGTIDVGTTSIMRGQMATVSGGIDFRSLPAKGSVFDLSTHSGPVSLRFASPLSARVILSTITGSIEVMDAVSQGDGGAGSRTLSFGNADAHITVRTFKGSILIRTPNSPKSERIGR